MINFIFPNSELNLDESIKTASYRKLHPLEQIMIIKFRTLENLNPIDILMNVIDKSKLNVYSLKKSLLKQFPQEIIMQENNHNHNYDNNKNNDNYINDKVENITFIDIEK